MAKPKRDYVKMVEEIVKLVDNKGINDYLAWEKVKEKHNLSEEEGKKLLDDYIEYCESKEEYKDEELNEEQEEQDLAEEKEEL